MSFVCLNKYRRFHKNQDNAPKLDDHVCPLKNTSKLCLARLPEVDAYSCLFVCCIKSNRSTSPSAGVPATSMANNAPERAGRCTADISFADL